ncbi:hypothetical protein LCGC14_0867470 [marine sediment metagenome]|uniref:Uncharacterized protein n=1 Tax=marine sediment metagenome TaxID=412755 RepID=A0A0F9PAI8_9ZZZZ
MAGDLFITSLGIFLFVLITGYLVQIILWGKDKGPFTTIINILAFIGVFIHEISHAVISIFSGAPVKSIRVRLRDEDTGRVAPHGEINNRRPYQKTFLQSLLISFGPVILGSWIFYFALQVAFNSLIDPLFRMIAGLMALSVLIASTPSPQDLRLIIVFFNFDSQHSFYQIIVLTASILLSWTIVVAFNIVFPIEFLYYGLIIFWYFTLKYLLLLIRWGFNKIRTRFGNEKNRTGFRRSSRRKYTSSQFQ